MRLLVSVANAAEASMAIAGGAELVDAKDPNRGALGAVAVGVLREIHAVVADRRPVTAALGDAVDEATLARNAQRYVEAGAILVKVGFSGVTDAAQVRSLLTAAVSGARAARSSAGVVGVAYADGDRASSPTPEALVGLAADAGAQGVLIDTLDKTREGLCRLVPPRALASWVAVAHEAGLFVALAGKLTADDLTLVRDVGADIAGVRGAACEGGRTGSVSADRVRSLRALSRPSARSTWAPLVAAPPS